MLEGFNWREDHRIHDRALICATIISPHVKKGMSPKKLLRQWKPQPTAQENVSKIDTLKARLDYKRRKQAMQNL
jgi:hypothetical protein